MGGVVKLKVAVLRIEEGPSIRVDRILFSLSSYREFDVYYVSINLKHMDLFNFLKDKIKHVDLGQMNTKLIRLRIEPYYSWVKKKIKRALSQIKPDVILAINVYAGVIAHELGYPVVVDDRELYSLKEFVIGPRGKDPFHIYSFGRKLHLFRKYEQLLTDYPIITVSKGIAEYYIGLGASKVWVVPNYPTGLEYEFIENTLNHLMENRNQRQDHIVLCYIGGKSDVYGEAKHRNIRPFLDVFISTVKENHADKIKLKIIGTKSLPKKYRKHPSITTTGRIPHSKVLEEALTCHYGILAWPPNPYNKYISPQKGYVYIATGNIPIVTGDAASYIETINDFRSIIINPMMFLESIKETLTRISKIFSPMHLQDRTQKVRLAERKTNWNILDRAFIEAIKKSK